jgi:LytS/YehU family sensor histidine kinase
MAQGKDKKALQWFMEYKDLSDSAMSAQSSRLLTEMNAKYETTQKEKEISLLKQEKEIHALEKAKDDQFFYFVIFSLLFIVILVYAIFSIRNSKIAKKMGEFERIALRAQMKPHFIFNALSSIQTFILESDLKNADRYISKFARLIRLILESSKMPTILLEDELHMLKLYIEIEQMRLENKFEYSIEVNPGVNAKSIRISSMLLQPFVENAIWHGISPKEGKGKLLISIVQSKTCIYCTIEDDGVGRSHAAEQNKLPGHKSMGMMITEKRLNLLHRRKILKKQLFQVEDLKKNGLAVGTRVNICIPFETNFYD